MGKITRNNINIKLLTKLSDLRTYIIINIVKANIPTMENVVVNAMIIINANNILIFL